MLNNPQLILLPQQWDVKSILGTNGTIIFWFFSNSSWLELDEIPDMDKKVLTITHLTDLKDLKTLLKEGLQLFLNENLWKGKFYFLYHLDLSQTGNFNLISLSLCYEENRKTLVPVTLSWPSNSSQFRPMLDV